VQQGREVIVGLRSEVVRIADRDAARPGEVLITGLVEHVEFQGHEVLVHVTTGSRPAVVPELEAPRPAARPPRRPRRQGRPGMLDRLRERAGSRRAGPVGGPVAGPVVVMEQPAQDATAQDAAAESARSGVRLPGDLVVRTTPDVRLHHGMQVPLLVDLERLFVFDRHGDRICPSPDRLPDLDE
jgi:multiple sugar transport system ATP-binding protein